MTVTNRTQSEDLHLRLKWLMLMRVSLVTFLFGVTLLINLRSPRSGLISSFSSLYFLIAYAYMLTGISAFIFPHVKRTTLFSYLQITGDILFITGILHITGGIESPFVFLYFLSIISGSILCYQQGSLMAALLTAFSFTGLFYINLIGLERLSASAIINIPASLYYKFFLNLFSFFVIAFLSNQLAKRIKMAGEEIQQKEDNIQDLEVFHENIIQSVTSGLITTDLFGKITSVNQSAEKILRVSKTDISRSNILDLFPYPQVRSYLQEENLQKDEESCRFEIFFTQRQDQEVILGMTLSLLGNKRGERAGFLCTFQDLTHIKALEDKMKRHEQLAMIGELSAGIAHEIRNPLASMSGSIEVLRSELELDEENKKLMNIILKETDRLNNLIGNFLKYARPRPLECEPFKIKDLLEETITLLKNNSRVGKSIHIEADLEEDLEAQVDSMAIRQVLWNLATNAVDAMPEGGTLRLSINRKTGRRKSNRDPGPSFVRITVADTGAGIPSEMKKKLFFPFHTTKEGGTGLGLAIAHQIVQQHGGWIDVVNQPGAGARFNLYLPEALQHAAS